MSSGLANQVQRIKGFVMDGDIFEARQSHDDQSLSALRQLGLGDEELIALRSQGYLQRDQRVGGKQPYWRLRFRFQGRLRTVYLGTDVAVVASVRHELAELQAPRDKQNGLSDQLTDGKRALRQAKERMKPILAEMGFHWHGDTIRKFRDAEICSGMNPGSDRGEIFMDGEQT